MRDAVDVLRSSRDEQTVSVRSSPFRSSATDPIESVAPQGEATCVPTGAFAAVFLWRVKSALMRELRRVEGLTVMPEESPVGASVANAMLERSVWEMQSTTRALVSFAEWVHGIVFEPGSAISTWAVEFSGQVVSKFQRSVSDGKTVYERRKLKSYRKALVLFGELVMFMPTEKPKDKGEVRNCVGIMLGLADRSDEVVIGTTERVVKARIAHRMLVEQRGDAAYAKSIRGVPWQPNPAEAAEGEPLGIAQARIVSVPIVAVENRPAVPVMEPRDYKAHRIYIRREVELAKYGFSDDCEGCRLAQVGAEAKPHSAGCRGRIRQAMMTDDVCQQRLRAAEKRVSSAGEQPSVATRVEAAQETPDEAMNQASAAKQRKRSACCEQREERQTQNGRERPNGGRCTVEKARI